jgi:hypothetical protein
MPVLAAIIAPTIITDTARLPLNPPKRSAILLNKSSARLDFSNSIPIKMNKGTATRLVLVISPNILLGIVPKREASKVPESIPKPANISAVPARENATGKPAKSTKQIIPNINRGMNSAIFYF